MKSSFNRLTELGAVPVNSQARSFLSKGKKKPVGKKKRSKNGQAVSKKRKNKRGLYIMDIFERQALKRNKKVPDGRS
jgi:hypothetical protein